MSLLTTLLLAKEPTVGLAIKQLEDKIGRKGIDTELIGDILQKGYSHAGQLGLDSDFNAKELYYSLINRVKADDERLARALGGKNIDDVAEMMPLIIKKFESLDLPRKGWFLKPAIARKMLKNCPPQNIMKRLGYKDVSLMLEKENIFEIFTAIRFGETAEWLNNFNEQYKSVKFKDFENRSIHVIVYDPKKWGDIAVNFVKKKLHNITHSKELGVIVAVPLPKKTMRGITLKMLPLLLHYCYEVHLYSAYFHLISTQKDFGKRLSETLIADTAHVPIMDGRHHVHWRVIQRYYGKLNGEQHPEVFQPHVQPEDLHWRKAEDELFKIDPELAFWRDMDYVALDIENEVVTFNLMDVEFNYSNGNSFEERNLYHFRESLWNELFERYMGQKVLEKEILQQLDNDLIAPEKIKL